MTWGYIYRDHFAYLCDKATKAIFGMYKKLRSVGVLPPHVMFYLFNSLIRPILVYGSDIWGGNKKGGSAIDKIFMWFLKCVLNVKYTTSNIIVIGECGLIPPRIDAHVNLLTFCYRVQNADDNSVLHNVYNELKKQHALGFKTWVSSAYELANEYHIDLSQNMPVKLFRQMCKLSIYENYKNKWFMELQDINKNPKLRTYQLFKKSFGMEKYLTRVTRTSSAASFTDS